MSKPFPLQILIDLAKEQSELAIRKLGELHRQSHVIDSKLDLLLQYRQEYQVRFDESVKLGMTRMEWQNYQHFFCKLDAAIDQQKQLQREFGNVVKAGQVEYQQQQKKLKSFETLAERHLALESAKAARREQKELDDFSSKAYLRKLRDDD